MYVYCVQETPIKAKLTTTMGTTFVISGSLSNIQTCLQALLADFRARGGRIRMPGIKEKESLEEKEIGSIVKESDDSMSMSLSGGRVSIQ